MTDCPGIGYYCAGEFTFITKCKASLRANVKFYLITGLILIIFLIYMAAKGHISWNDLVGFAVCLANTYGLIIAILMLGNAWLLHMLAPYAIVFPGYGLVEMPRALWYHSSRLVRLKFAQFKIAQCFNEVPRSILLRSLHFGFLMPCFSL